MTSGARKRENEQPYERVLNDGVELAENLLDAAGCLALCLGGWLVAAVVLNGIFGDLPGLLDWLLLAASCLVVCWLWSRTEAVLEQPAGARTSQGVTRSKLPALSELCAADGSASHCLAARSISHPRALVADLHPEGLRGGGRSLPGNDRWIPIACGSPTRRNGTYRWPLEPPILQT